MRKLFLLIVLLTLSTFAAAQHKVALTWTQSVSTGVTGNNVFKSTTSGGPYTKIFSSSTPIVGYTDLNVVALGTYFYVVTATCSTCNPTESGFSNQVSATIPGDAQPPAPTGLTATSQ